MMDNECPRAFVAFSDLWLFKLHIELMSNYFRNILVGEWILIANFNSIQYTSIYSAIHCFAQNKSHTNFTASSIFISLIHKHGTFGKTLIAFIKVNKFLLYRKYVCNIKKLDNFSLIVKLLIVSADTAQNPSENPKNVQTKPFIFLFKPLNFSS
jgi:hypothetical protein